MVAINANIVKAKSVADVDRLDLFENLRNTTTSRMAYPIASVVHDGTVRHIQSVEGFVADRSMHTEVDINISCYDGRTAETESIFKQRGINFTFGECAGCQEILADRCCSVKYFAATHHCAEGLDIVRIGREQGSWHFLRKPQNKCEHRKKLDGG